jgi:hypothetical protein
MSRKVIELEIVNLDGVETEAKRCTKCDEVKPLLQYGNDKKGKFGKQSQCKVCKKYQDQTYNKKNKEKIAAKSREYRKKNAEYLQEKGRQYRANNKEAIAEYMRQYGQMNSEALRKKRKAHYEANKEKYSEYSKAYYQENKQTIINNHKRYYEKNKPIVLQKQKQYVQKNAEIITVRKREYAQRNADRIRVYKQSYHQENAAEIREKKKRYRLANEEAIKKRKKEYYEENKHIKAANSQRRRAIQKQLPNVFTAADATELMRIFNYSCAVSNLTNEDIHLDHFIALATGHAGTIKGNMLPIAANLNISKNYYNPFVWVQRKDIAQQLDVKKWRAALKYLASENRMNIKQFREYVYECYANPVSLEER